MQRASAFSLKTIAFLRGNAAGRRVCGAKKSPSLPELARRGTRFSKLRETAGSPPGCSIG